MADKLQEIAVAPEMMPRKDPKRTCKCMNEPVKLETKKGTLTWIKNVGDTVKAGELICEGEVEKKIVEFIAPCDGIVAEQCIKDGEVFTAGSILGYIKRSLSIAKFVEFVTRFVTVICDLTIDY